MANATGQDHGLPTKEDAIDEAASTGQRAVGLGNKPHKSFIAHETKEAADKRRAAIAKKTGTRRSLWR